MDAQQQIILTQQALSANPQAIALLIRDRLEPTITVKAALKDGCLYLLLAGEQAPSARLALETIEPTIEQLALNGLDRSVIQAVKVGGQSITERSPKWCYHIDLPPLPSVEADLAELSASLASDLALDALPPEPDAPTEEPTAELTAPPIAEDPTDPLPEPEAIAPTPDAQQLQDLQDLQDLENLTLETPSEPEPEAIASEVAAEITDASLDDAFEEAGLDEAIEPIEPIAEPIAEPMTELLAPSPSPAEVAEAAEVSQLQATLAALSGLASSLEKAAASLVNAVGAIAPVPTEPEPIAPDPELLSAAIEEPIADPIEDLTTPESIADEDAIVLEEPTAEVAVDVASLEAEDLEVAEPETPEIATDEPAAVAIDLEEANFLGIDPDALALTEEELADWAAIEQTSNALAEDSPADEEDLAAGLIEETAAEEVAPLEPEPIAEVPEPIAEVLDPVAAAAETPDPAMVAADIETDAPIIDEPSLDEPIAEAATDLTEDLTEAPEPIAEVATEPDLPTEAIDEVAAVAADPLPEEPVASAESIEPAVAPHAEPSVSVAEKATDAIAQLVALVASNPTADINRALTAIERLSLLASPPAPEPIAPPPEPVPTAPEAITEEAATEPDDLSEPSPIADEIATDDAIAEAVSPEAVTDDLGTDDLGELTDDLGTDDLGELEDLADLPVEEALDDIAPESEAEPDEPVAEDVADVPLEAGLDDIAPEDEPIEDAIELDAVIEEAAEPEVLDLLDDGADLEISAIEDFEESAAIAPVVDEPEAIEPEAAGNAELDHPELDALDLDADLDGDSSDLDLPDLDLPDAIEDAAEAALSEPIAPAADEDETDAAEPIAEDVPLVEDVPPEPATPPEPVASPAAPAPSDAIGHREALAAITQLATLAEHRSDFDLNSAIATIARLAGLVPEPPPIAPAPAEPIATAEPEPSEAAPEPAIAPVADLAPDEAAADELPELPDLPDLSDLTADETDAASEIDAIEEVAPTEADWEVEVAPTLEDVPAIEAAPDVADVPEAIEPEALPSDEPEPVIEDDPAPVAELASEAASDADEFADEFEGGLDFGDELDKLEPAPEPAIAELADAADVDDTADVAATDDLADFTGEEDWDLPDLDADDPTADMVANDGTADEETPADDPEPAAPTATVPDPEPELTEPTPSNAADELASLVTQLLATSPDPRSALLALAESLGDGAIAAPVAPAITPSEPSSLVTPAADLDAAPVAPDPVAEEEDDLALDDLDLLGDLVADLPVEAAPEAAIAPAPEPLPTVVAAPPEAHSTVSEPEVAIDPSAAFAWVNSPIEPDLDLSDAAPEDEAAPPFSSWDDEDDLDLFDAEGLSALVDIATQALTTDSQEPAIADPSPVVSPEPIAPASVDRATSNGVGHDLGHEPTNGLTNGFTNGVTHALAPEPIEPAPPVVAVPIAIPTDPLSQWLHQGEDPNGVVPAPAPDLPATTGEGQRFLRFHLGFEDTALLPVDEVREVLRIAATDILPVPHMPESVLGVYNWRGEIVWMIDLNQLVGFPAIAPNLTATSMAVAIVLECDAQNLGLVVPQIEDIEWHDSPNVQPPSAGLFPDRLLPFVQGYLSEASSMVLNPSAIARASAHAAV
jgi:chemotaxis signal transduction protein